jgi:hypothetical protein
MLTGILLLAMGFFDQPRVLFHAGLNVAAPGVLIELIVRILKFRSRPSIFERESEPQYLHNCHRSTNGTPALQWKKDKQT